MNKTFNFIRNEKSNLFLATIEKGGFGKGDKFFAVGSNTHWLTLQNDGNLVIYYGAYPSTVNHRWFSGSYEKN